jgi:hypothetical protein
MQPLRYWYYIFSIAFLPVIDIVFVSVCMQKSGKYLHIDGESGCFSCAKGMFASASGSTICSNCLQGLVCESHGE